MKTIGFKLVRRDCGSIRDLGRVFYTTEWQEIPGNGAYVSVYGSLLCAGDAPLLIALQCDGPIQLENLPPGVECYRRVRRIPLPDDLPDWVREFAARNTELTNASNLTGDINRIWGDARNLRGDVNDELCGDVSRLTGDVSGVTGEVSNLRGDVTNLIGNVTGLYGDVTGMTGDASEHIKKHNEK